jgi:type III secretory pathway component EscS
MKSSYLIHHYFELAAALAASFYWLKTKDNKVRPFVWFLWLTVTVETIGLYPLAMQNNYDNKIFIYLKNSVFCRNMWLYNAYSSIGLILVGLFFLRNLQDQTSKKIIKIVLVVCTAFAIIYYLTSGQFFKMSLPYDNALQTFAIFIFVLLYFRELMGSEEILAFYKSHVFFISVALLIWNICLTPLFIFDGYYRAINPEFVAFRTSFLTVSNILLYSCYVFAFLISLYYKGKLAPKK